MPGGNEEAWPYIKVGVYEKRLRHV
jgi:hypothetical protein